MNWKTRKCRGASAKRRFQKLRASQKRGYIVVFFIVMFSLCRMNASSLDDFKAANQLYDAGKFTEAIAAYEKIEPKAAHVFYNLGNACYRANQLGKAVLHYERARRLAPRDPDILANLKFTQERLGVDAANISPKAIERFLHSVVASRTPNEWSGYEVAGLWAVVMAVGLWIWMPRGRGVWATISIVAFLCFAATASVLAYRVTDERRAPRAIVLTKQTDARFAPLMDATVHFKLAEGTKVRVREDRGQWLYVERADGQQGWVPAEVVGRVGLY